MNTRFIAVPPEGKGGERSAAEKLPIKIDAPSVHEAVDIVDKKHPGWVLYMRVYNTLSLFTEEEGSQDLFPS
jgi:hypothetical protein